MIQNIDTLRPKTGSVYRQKGYPDLSCKLKEGNGRRAKWRGDRLYHKDSERPGRGDRGATRFVLGTLLFTVV